MGVKAESAAAGRELPLRRVRNVRDLGGYAWHDDNGDGGTTAFGRFLRGPSLRRANARDRAYLASYGEGLARVIDLRSDFEVKHWPDPYADGSFGADYMRVPMLDQLNSGGFRDALPDRMFTVYRRLLDKDAASIAQVVQALDAPGTVLFHCRVGKDRTGVIAALLLSLAGVSDADVVADYAATQQYMGRFLGVQRVAVSVGLCKRAPRSLFEAVPEEMALTMEHMRRTYGTARDYLTAYAGCDEALVDRLCERLRGE